MKLYPDITSHLEDVFSNFWSPSGDSVYASNTSNGDAKKRVLSLSDRGKNPDRFPQKHAIRRYFCDQDVELGHAEPGIVQRAKHFEPHNAKFGLARSLLCTEGIRDATVED